jgi:GAF domain-containing protein
MSELDLSLHMVKLSEEMRKSGGWPSDDVLNRLAIEIGAAFGARKDEVAVLFLSQEGMLSFMHPVKFSKLGAIPTSSGRSLAVKTVREKRGEVVNNFSVYKHPTVFESVNPSEEMKAAPIQKIMSVPMIAGEKVAGVIQVSRKGRAGDPIGPDFTSRDLAELMTAGSILAKFFATLPSHPPAKP